MTTFHFIRHEQSEGNKQAKAALESGAHRLDIPWDSPDVPLTEEGFARAQAIQVPEATLVFTSPYRRAQQTMHACIPDIPFFMRDVRVRDKELGVFDKLSNAGAEALYPNEWAQRLKFGKFYHRPPEGESWMDVLARVQSFMDSVSQFGHDSVLVFSHDVPILLAIMICRRMTPTQILTYQKTNPVENGSITTLKYEGNHNGQAQSARAASKRVGLDAHRRESVAVW